MYLWIKNLVFLEPMGSKKMNKVGQSKIKMLVINTPKKKQSASAYWIVIEIIMQIFRIG
jgi:hypothetical protein